MRAWLVSCHQDRNPGAQILEVWSQTDLQCSFSTKKGLLSTHRSAIREAPTVFSGVSILMAADKPCPQLQPSLMSPLLQKDTLYLVMRCTRWRQGANHCALLCVSLLVRVLIYVRTFLMTIIFLKVGIVWTRQLIISFIIMDLIMYYFFLASLLKSSWCHKNLCRLETCRSQILVTIPVLDS